jgi:ubiquinone/menaquinone biosynthesis C-methylase UbiE
MNIFKKRADQKTHIKQESAFFNHISGKGDYDALTENGYNKIMSFVRPAKEDNLILDIGCGTGAFSRRLCRYGKVIGMDVSSGMVKVAKTLPDNIECHTFLAGNAEELPFQDSIFDMVFYGGVLHHLPDFKKSVKETYRVLKNGGTLVAFEPNGYHPYRLIFTHPKSPVRGSTYSPSEHPVYPGRIIKVLNSYGFTDARIHYLHAEYSSTAFFSRLQNRLGSSNLASRIIPGIMRPFFVISVSKG